MNRILSHRYLSLGRRVLKPDSSQKWTGQVVVFKKHPNGLGEGLIRGTPVDDPAGLTLEDNQQPPLREFPFYDEDINPDHYDAFFLSHNPKVEFTVEAQYEDREFRDADWPLGNPHVGEVATAVNVNAPEGLGSIPRGDKASVHYRFGASVSEFPWFPLEKGIQNTNNPENWKKWTKEEMSNFWQHNYQSENRAWSGRPRRSGRHIIQYKKFGVFGEFMPKIAAEKSWYLSADKDGQKLEFRRPEKHEIQL